MKHTRRIQNEVIYIIITWSRESRKKIIKGGKTMKLSIRRALPEPPPEPHIQIALEEDNGKIRVVAYQNGVESQSIITFYSNGVIHRHTGTRRKLEAMGFVPNAAGEVATYREVRNGGK